MICKISDEAVRIIIIDIIELQVQRRKSGLVGDLIGILAVFHLRRFQVPRRIGRIKFVVYRAIRTTGTTQLSEISTLLYL